MKDTNNRIHPQYTEILETLKGKKLEKVSIDYGDSLNHSLSQFVILHLPNESISLWSTEKQNCPDEYPDLAEISVCKETEEQRTPSELQLVSFPINETIKTIEEVIETVAITEPGKKSFAFTNTKAIIIHCDQSTLFLEKTCYWSEVWTITLQPKEANYTFYNEWNDVEKDDLTAYNVTLEHHQI